MAEYTVTYEQPSSRRALAAIVFTDTAGSSTLMGENEEKTLKLMQRDFELMTRLCNEHAGKVLKSTGDGLLMYFESAVQAVACALQVQHGIMEQARKLPADQVLMHRIGIHLGDVFVSETDVMGDGVNIAARLQTEAEPGGICISQTVYDVVKNRLAVQATYLGPRELKNIKDAIPVYQILLDAAGAAVQSAGVVGAGMKVRAAKKVGTPGWLIGTLIAGGVVAAGVLVVLIILATRTPQVRVDISRDEPGTGQPPRAGLGGAGATSTPSGTGQTSSGGPVVQPGTGQTSSGGPVVQPGTGQTAAGRDANTPTVGAATTPGTGQEVTPTAAGPSQQEINDARRKFLANYRYKGMMDWLAEKGLKDSELYKRYQKFQMLPLYLRRHLEVTESKAVSVAVPSAQGAGKCDLWTSSDGTLKIRRSGGMVEDATLEGIDHPLMAEVIRSALKEQPGLDKSVHSMFVEECQAAGLIPK
jgi:class 3 adenylate cyclase